jgi:hypothetical protein
MAIGLEIRPELLKFGSRELLVIQTRKKAS